jgi:hypothetical protein
VLPTSSVTLSGVGLDLDGSISSYVWSKISGPSSGSITNANSAGTTVTSLVQGIYQFQLRVADNMGAIGLDTVKITVNTGDYVLPTAYAGSDQSIILPTNSVSLQGSATGSISSYNWTKLSGPSAGTIMNSNLVNTQVTGLVQGTYQFQLMVTDSRSSTAVSTVSVVVNSSSANLLPSVNPSNVVNGLDYKYYEGSSYSVVPDFSTITPVKSGSANNFDITQANRVDVFAFNFTGYINVPSDGQYTFYTSSDDGSLLYIDGFLVVNNDNKQGVEDMSGRRGLKA